MWPACQWFDIHFRRSIYDKPCEFGFVLVPEVIIYDHFVCSIWPADQARHWPDTPLSPSLCQTATQLTIFMFPGTTAVSIIVLHQYNNIVVLSSPRWFFLICSFSQLYWLQYFLKTYFLSLLQYSGTCLIQGEWKHDQVLYCRIWTQETIQYLL